MNTTFSDILILLISLVFILFGYFFIIKFPRFEKWFNPFATNWYVLISTLFLLSMCIGLNLGYNDNSWIIFISGVVVMTFLFIDVFSTKNSAIRRLILIILSIGFLVGASVASVEDNYKWLAYLISLILFIAVIAYFLVTKKFNDTLNIKSLFKLIEKKTIFIYFVIAFIIVSLIFQCIQFSSNTKLGSFTIVLGVFIVLFILYFIIKNPLSSTATPRSLRGSSGS
jgi:hypothetical protein